MSFEQLNQNVESWSKNFKQKLIARAKAGAVKQSIRTRIKKQSDVPTGITTSFSKIGIYQEKGARRGHGGPSGKGTWLNQKGEKMRVNPKSVGKMNTGRAKAAPWFNPTLVEEFPKLVAAVTDGVTGEYVTELKYLLIKGA